MFRKYPSIFILVFTVVGIISADMRLAPAWLYLSLTLLCCLTGLLLLSYSRRAVVPFLFGLSLLFFAGFHFSIKYYDVGARHIARYISQKKVYHIYGEVSDWPDLKTDRTEIKIELDSVTDTRTYRVSGTILLKISDTTTVLQRGDRVEFYGRIYPVRGGSYSSSFDYRRYLNLKGVFGIVYLPTLLDLRIDKGNRYSLFNFVDHLRTNIRNCFYAHLSLTAAALASGFLIGETRDIPTEIYHRFRDSGTLHLLAVSGSNVALVVLFLIIIMRPFSISRKKRSLVLLAVILIFNLLSYGEPSVMRASIMASLVILAGYIERRYDLNNIIALTAVIILLFDPAQLFDIGFQLSFTIAWGLIYILPRLTIYFKSYQNRWWYRWLAFPFLIALVAQFCSVGLIALYFHRIPILSPLANLVIVPLVSLAVVGILFLLLADLIFPLLGAVVGSWLNVLLNLILTMVEFMGAENVPLLKIPEVSIVVILFLYAYLFFTVWSLQKRTVRKYIVLSLLVLVNVAFGGEIINSFDNETKARVTLFSVPGGVSAIIQKPKSDYADIVITGLSAKKYPIEERIIYPQLERSGITQINSLFLLSAEYGALDDILHLTEKYMVKEVYLNRYLIRSFEDVLKNGMVNPRKFELTVYSDIQADIQREGYYPSQVELLLNFVTTQIVFSDRLRPEYFQTAGDKEKILVIGKTWQASLEDWAKLYRAGFKKIICPKIEQSDQFIDPEEPYVQNGYQGDYMYDLSRVGRLTLNIDKTP